MVKRFVCAAMTVMMAATLFTGCVKVVKIGEEGALTGQVEFNPGDSVEEIWDSAVLPEFEGKAVDINEVLEKANGDLTSLGEEAGGVKTKSATSYNYCVKLEGATVASVDKDSFYGTAVLTVPGYEGDINITCQIGQYKGSSVRDAQTIIKFADFTNQTEWGQINTTMLQRVDETVVKPVYDDLAEGATVDLIGYFTADSAKEMVITPVELTVK